MKDYVLRNLKGLQLVLVAILILGVVEFQNIKYNKQLTKNLNISRYETKASLNLSEEELVNSFLEEKTIKINFYANIFQINTESFIKLLKNNYQELDLLNTNDIDKVLINYLERLEISHKELFDYNIKPNHTTKEYMLTLIRYFTKIYDNVDYNIASAIAQIESGYKAKYMMQCNNIFGGMSNGKLIKYRTIEYGILKYIKLLSENYFAKGLNTIEKIGRVYNPVITESGEKIASPTWVINVKKVLNNNFINEIDDIREIITLQNNVNF